MALGPPKQRAVLAILATHCGQVVSTMELIDAVWGPAPPRTAAHSVQMYVSDLRKLFGGHPSIVIETSRPGYRLVADQGSIDVVEFQRLVAIGAATGDRTALETALGLWVAEPLDDFRFEEWARPLADDLRSQRSEAAVHLAAVALDHDPQRALHWAEIALDSAPLAERACELVMLSQYRLGHHADALRVYDDFRRRLGSERGLVPTPALERRRQQVLTHDPSLDTPSMVGVGGAGRRARRRVSALGVAAVALVALTGGVVVALANDTSSPAPRRALLLHNVLSEIREQYVNGFEEATSSTGLLAESLDIEADAESIDRALQDGVDVVVAPAVGFDIAAVAAEHPDTTFVAFDQVVPGSNVTSIIVNTHEASYLAGVAAALTTRTKSVGFIGGVDEELIWEFAAGFAAGVEATDGDIEVATEYLADPSDFGAGYQNPAAAEAAARRMYTAGADVIFSAAGTSGLGVFEAAADLTVETGTFRWAIGVDTDQYRTVRELPVSVDAERWSPHILTSVLKHSDEVVRDVTIAYTERDLEPGIQLIGLADGAGGLSYSGGFLDAHRARLERVREQIIAGQIVVPCRPANRLDASTPQRPHPCEMRDGQ
jgi:basic membrane protein A